MTVVYAIGPKLLTWRLAQGHRFHALSGAHLPTGESVLEALTTDGEVDMYDPAPAGTDRKTAASGGDR